MQHFTGLSDVANPSALLAEAALFAQHPHQKSQLGKGKSLGLIFFNASLRTRMSTQRAGQSLGMDVTILNVSQDSWQLEFEDGTVMDGAKAEHIKEAAAVMGSYCDILGIRTFAGLKNRTVDYAEHVLTAFQQYAGVPIVSLESATRHPLQSLTDWLTIHQQGFAHRPKVVLTWAPHPKALPQAVGNSFVEWMQAAEVDLTIAHPYGMDLSPDFVKDTPVMYNQDIAFEGADIIYAKNWSSFKDYGHVNDKERDWQITAEKMTQTNNAKFMHCLPVRRNMVVADEVLDSPQSIVISQAANRIPAAQAVLATILETL
ncbi:MAG: N-acetylornithine carbamoyltransferase [Bacteroidota bacterium]